MKSYALALIFLFQIFLSFDDIEACPSHIFAQEFRPILKHNRNTYKLLVLDVGQPKWREIPLQIDPITNDGRIEFFKNASWQTQKISPNDRLVFRSEELTTRAKKDSDKIPCLTLGSVYELRGLYDQNYGYLIQCENFDLEKISQSPKGNRVVFDKKQSLIQSYKYNYWFDPTNHMLFNKIEIGHKAPKKVIAENSNISIHSDIKNFLTLDFDKSDIESYLEEIYTGPLGVNARVSFYLKILYLFTIKLALTTDVSFYEDSANIPMVIHIPDAAPGKLNSGSGIIYSWDSNVPSRQNVGSNIIRMLKDEEKKLIKSNFTKLGQSGLELCSGMSRCKYQYGMTIDEHQFVMDLNIPRSLVQLGFFPLLVEDMKKYKKELNWEVPVKDKTIGLYFETTGLPAGSNSWDFWMHLGDKPKLDIAKKCPSPVYLRSI